MAGTVSKPVFFKDGQYISLTADNALAIGDVVKLTTTGCDKAEDGDTAFGVVTGGNRFSRTATDNTIAEGQLATVCTRGIVHVYTDTSAILVGSFVKPADHGIVALDASPSIDGSIGIAMEPNGSAAATIKVKLIRG
jgi:predicted RecA/RadA family phage recombinase